MNQTPNGKRKKYVTGSVLGATIGAGVLFFLYLLYLLGPVDATASFAPAEKFTIESGDGFKKIAADLATRKLIRSSSAFKVWSFLTGSAHRLKPGDYELNRRQTTPEIVHLLVEGLPEDITVLIPEGATLKEIDQKLAEVGILPPEALVNFPVETLKERYRFLGDARTLEGFLFPDTYRFFPNSEPGVVVERFLGTWERQALPLITSSPEILYDVLIKASLIEKEVPFDDERPIVAGIYDRRVALGLPLQVDATIVYAKCRGVFKGCPSLMRNDFNIDSAFNTYRRLGLPPTPVANPSRGSIRAAANPQSSTYLYYLSDPATKRTVFSTTLDEHNANKVRYLR